MNNESGLTPIEDRVLLKVVEVEAKSAGGIVLAQTTKDTEDMASVHGHFVTGGEEALERLGKHGIKPGDLVLYARYAGMPYVGKDGCRYRVMNASDVVARSEGVFDVGFKGRGTMAYKE